MVDVIKMLEDFPFIVPSRDFKEWSGIIPIEDEEVSVTIAVPSFPNLKDISFICPVHWETKLHQKLKIYQNSPCREDNLVQLLQYLKNREGFSNCNLEVINSSSDCATSLHLYGRVFGELRQIGCNKVVDCSAELSRVTLHKVDGRGVEHRVVVGLPSDYPTSNATVVDADLPEIAVLQLSQAKTIVEIMNSFDNLIESLQDFWIVYDELKSDTWIIDPENPRLKDTHFRIIIGENVSMLVVLNPQDVNSCPDIKFLGPENLVSPFINSVENNIKFPQRDTEVEADVTQGECSICFTVRLHDNAPLPGKVCNNTRCDSYFHISCLAQWFQAVPTNEASFNLISGGCPSCGEKILCPVTVS